MLKVLKSSCPLRLAPRAPAGALEPLHEVVAAAEQRFVLRLERALTFTSQVEAPNLLHRPTQTAMQAGDDGFQVVDKRFDVGLEHRRRRHIGIGFRPSLPKYPLHDCGQILRMALHEIAQGAQVERRTPHLASVEQERRHSGRQAAGEHVPNLVPFRLRPIRVAYATVQAGDNRRMNVLGDHRLVAQVEGGWVDPAGEQLDRIGEVGAVVRYGATVGDVHRHAMTASRATRPLPVVGRKRRDVSHKHGVELADVDAELQGRRAHQAVDCIRRSLEEILQPFALRLGDHGRVLLGAQHRVGAVEKLEVVVVVVFRDPYQNAVAAPRGAAVVRHVPGGGAAAAPAALHIPVRVQTQPVRVHLVDAMHVRQRTAPGTLELHRHQQSAVHQKVEQALQEPLDALRCHTPLPGNLAHRGVAARAQPLGDLRRLFRRVPPELGAVRREEARQIALLDLAVALHPVLGEDLVFGVVQGALAPQVVEDAGDTLAQATRGDAERMGTLLNPGQGGVEPFVLDLHPSPGLQPERLPR